MADRANPAFAVGAVAVPLAATGYALTGAPLTHHTYVHVMAGVLWTGIDLFMGSVLGPVVGGLDEEESAAVFSRLTPKTTFLLPALAVTTIATGIGLALRLALFETASAWLALFAFASLVPTLALIGRAFDAWTDPRWAVPTAAVALGSLAWVGTTVGGIALESPLVIAALAVVALLSIQGFGVLLPGEIRIYQQIRSASPDASVIAAVGARNAKLAGVQGVLQLTVVALMVGLRYGGL